MEERPAHRKSDEMSPGREISIHINTDDNPLESTIFFAIAGR